MSENLAVDFDGVLHPYTNGWMGTAPANEPPAPGAREFLLWGKSRGFNIIVFSVRANTTEGMGGILSWLIYHDLDHFVDEITDKKPPAVAYVDDRAVPFTGDFMAAREAVSRLVEKNQ